MLRLGFDYKYDVPILSPIHQHTFRPTSLQQVNFNLSKAKILTNAGILNCLHLLLDSFL